MKDGFEFHGSFYTSKAYPDAPNPCLNLAGFGSVALPLQIPTATGIINLCNRAPFGKGNETVVDAKVRDTWELGPSKVCWFQRSEYPAANLSHFPGEIRQRCVESMDERYGCSTSLRRAGR
jgi:hypothetical protein